MKNAAVARIGVTKTVRVRTPRIRKSGADLGVVAQVRVAFQPRNRLATVLGGLLGGFVPVATYTVAHHEVKAVVSVMTLLVLGGLCYSAKTVYAWGRLAFNSGAKALGFTLLVEGVMTLAHTPWLAWAALGYLVAINAVATGCTLALPAVKKEVE